jgi:hypothetical protein
VIAAVGATMLSAGWAAYVWSMAWGHDVVGVTGALGVLCVAIGGGVSTRTVALVLLSGQYLLALVLADISIDPVAPAMGLWFLAIFEVVCLRGSGTDVDRTVVARRIGSILVAVATGGLLAVAVMWVGIEVRIAGPAAVGGAVVVILALLGLVVNLTSTALDQRRSRRG